MLFFLTLLASTALALNFTKGKADANVTVVISYNTTIGLDFSYVNSFLTGAKATQFAPSVMECSALVQEAAESLNETMIKRQEPVVFGVAQDVSSRVAPAVGVCYDTAYSFYGYLESKVHQCNGFTLLAEAFA